MSIFSIETLIKVNKTLQSIGGSIRVEHTNIFLYCPHLDKGSINNKGSNFEILIFDIVDDAVLRNFEICSTWGPIILMSAK